MSLARRRRWAVALARGHAIGNRRAAIVRTDDACCAGCLRRRRIVAKPWRLIDPCDRFDPVSAGGVGNRSVEAAVGARHRRRVARLEGDEPRAAGRRLWPRRIRRRGCARGRRCGSFPIRRGCGWRVSSKAVRPPRSSSASERLARSPGGVTIALDSRPSVSTAQWSGASDRARSVTHD